MRSPLSIPALMLTALATLGCSAPAGSTTGSAANEQTATPDAPEATPPVDAKAEPVPEPAPVPVPATPPEPKWEPRAEDSVEVHQALENPEALAPFFDALAAIDDGEKKVVRVVHLGASMIGADDLPSVLRERFQTRFGDGGAGLVLLQRYMPNYIHRWVNMQASGWEHCYLAYLCKKDGHYGLGGTTFWSKGGATTTISTRKDELGDETSKFELWYLAQPGGGRIELKVDNEEREIIDTRADALEDRWHTIDVEQGPHKIRVRAVGYGNARAYGVALETDGPGIVWDQFSKLGVFTKKMLAWDAAHIKAQVAHRDPDLIVFTYGGNDLRRVANKRLTGEQYVEEYSESIAHIRAGKPDAPCLITSITDRAKSLTFDITPEHVETIVTAQREVAKQQGCAFFDTWTAMGGAGSLKEWKRRSPPLAAGDLKHLNHRGRVLLGGWIYDAIIDEYVKHRTGGG